MRVSARFGVPSCACRRITSVWRNSARDWSWCVLVRHRKLSLRHGGMAISLGSGNEVPIAPAIQDEFWGRPDECRAMEGELQQLAALARCGCDCEDRGWFVATTRHSLLVQRRNNASSQCRTIRPSDSFNRTSLLIRTTTDGGSTSPTPACAASISSWRTPSNWGRGSVPG